MSSDQKEEFAKAIGQLPSEGGGDCPEKSVTGMLNALGKEPKYGSPMFVFTDASAKDDGRSHLEALKSAASLHGTTITFFTRRQGCFGEQSKGIRSYQEIATHTSGKESKQVEDSGKDSFKKA